MTSTFRFVIVATLILGCFDSTAGSGTRQLHPFDLEVVQTPTFLRHHPDLRWRLDGLAALGDGRAESAFANFRLAARYGDRVSQGMLAEMLWSGQGTTSNRPLAYAWMDLAAERGHVTLIGKREHYWSALSENERNAALALGEEVYRQYGDVVALPRLHAAISKGKRVVSGSRVGAGAGAMVIYPSGPADKVTISTLGGFGPAASGGKVSVHRMWSSQFWDTEKYLDWKAVELDGEPVGVVDVLPLRTDRD